MVSPGVAPVPVRVGVLSSVTSPLVSGPCSTPTSSVMPPKVGTAGAAVSMVSANAVLLLSLPRTAVAV